MNQEMLRNIGLLWLRVMAGSGMMYHGFSKVFGGTMDQMTAGVANLGFPFPVVFAWLAALSEFLGGIFLIVGFQTQIAALFIFITMSVAAFLVHAADPFKVKELALAYLAMSGALVFMGGGKFSLSKK